MSNDGVALLDQALAVAQEEEKAIDSKNYEQAVELSQQRHTLIDLAWEKRGDVPSDVYRTRLLQLADIQKRLQEKLQQAHAIVRSSLQHTHREQKRLKAYHKCVAMAFH